ncbi:MAG: hypothetical protein QF746_05815 [Candidatus Thalassarchaeaceae archaeon]|nr:hypothetical protein [Candidatus Thalassarchaeaceae archaeon]|tara:strand:- start:3263 stop:4492 length:1230 start_codon:yes stop_codon:yes gene_type:complete
MSSGGLLEKAAKQQTGDANLGAPPNTAAISTADEGGSNSTMRLIGLIFGGMVVPYFVVMWFGGVFLGDDTATTVSVGFLSFVVLAIAGTGIWLISGRPAPASVQTIAIGLTFILLLSSNFAIALLLTGEMSLGEIEHDEESDELVVKIRQNGGSGTYDASISIAQGNYVYTSEMEVTINREDGQGDYGWLKIPIQDFYNQNALPMSDYTMSIQVDGNTWTRNLDANVLSRTITGSDVSADPSFKTQDCEGSAKEQCLSGVGLSVTAGLLGSSQDYIAGMPLADYDLKVTMTLDGSIAVDYPMIQVRHTSAAWQSNGGEYGSGSGYIGDDGPTLVLGGSVIASDINQPIILKEDWSDSGFGCYEVTVLVTNLSPWSTETVEHTTLYVYEETNMNEGGQYMSESWTEVQSC